MAQERYYNFGGSADDDAENKINYALHEKGVYRGMELSVGASGGLQIDAGYYLQHNGIVIRETNSLTLPYIPPADATTYTILSEHENNDLLGGAPAVYSIFDGQLVDDDVANGIVLGWIFAPAGAVPLSDDYILSAPKRLVGENVTQSLSYQPIELIPIFPRAGFSDPDPAFPHITFDLGTFDDSDYLMVQTVSTPATAVPDTQEITQSFVFFYNGYRPQQVSLYAKFPNTPSTNITLQVLDTEQTPVAFEDGTTTSMFSGADDWTELTSTLRRWGGTFDEGRPYTVRITYSVYKGETVKLGRFTLTRDPNP